MDTHHFSIKVINFHLSKITCTHPNPAIKKFLNILPPGILVHSGDCKISNIVLVTYNYLLFIHMKKQANNVYFWDKWWGRIHQRINGLIKQCVCNEQQSWSKIKQVHVLWKNPCVESVKTIKNIPSNEQSMSRVKAAWWYFQHFYGFMNVHVCDKFED